MTIVRQHVLLTLMISGILIAAIANIRLPTYFDAIRHAVQVQGAVVDQSCDQAGRAKFRYTSSGLVRDSNIDLGDKCAAMYGRLLVAWVGAKNDIATLNRPYQLMQAELGRILLFSFMSGAAISFVFYVIRLRSRPAQSKG